MFKKIISLILLFIVSSAIVNALSSDQKGAILDDFKKKQYDLLFESNLWDFSSEYSDIFNISKKMSIYENIWNKVEQEREVVQSKNIALIEKILSLEESVKQIDIDISNTLIKVDKINNNVIQIKKEIEINSKTIWILKTKISENMEILLEYLIYIYKKWNTVYDETEIDNLKSILLNEEDISDVINDLYYKWIIQIAWKKLIDNHRKYISDLYMKKVTLEKQEVDLKKMRKLWIIEKKILADKKAFKERILEVSKWQQSYYQKYVLDKLEVEKNIILNTFKEKIKFNNLRDNILKKYGCDFVDVSKYTAESRVLSWKCLDINKMIYSESILDNSKINEGNFFSWPIQPKMWISRYYHDPEYKKDFWSEHDALDIIADQGTSIRAPADWYVIYIEEPDSEDYAYVALKHYDWYMTIYGHVSDVLVWEFDYVKKWEIFAQTWWEFGTLWAWFLTTGPHLHWSVYLNGNAVDPSLFLPLNLLLLTPVFLLCTLLLPCLVWPPLWNWVYYLFLNLVVIDQPL